MEQPRLRAGHQYQHNQVRDRGRAHFGDAYYISREDPLSLLPSATNAPFNSYDKRHDPICLPNTRIGVLQEIISWVGGQDKRCIFWLNGAAGSGKSTIARTIAQKYNDEGRLGASFFFSRGGRDVSHASKFFSSIASQLANRSSILKDYICEAIAKDWDIASKGLRDQWTHLILQPLSRLEDNSFQSPFLVVIDALDECDEDNDIRAILQCLVDLNRLEIARLYICITSRPETPIRLGFRAIPEIVYRDLVLHNVPRTTVDQDISIFFSEKFKKLRDVFEDPAAEWPGDENINLLVEKCEGLFIYAATVYRFVKGDEEWPPQDRLDIFLSSAGSNPQSRWEHSILFASPTWELDQMYTKVLQHSFEKIQENKDKLIKLFKQVIGSIAIVSEPLSAIAFAKLLGLPLEWINRRLQRLHSVLKIPKDQEDLIRLYHSSFRDFLLHRDRCSDSRFWVDGKQAHQTLANCCLRLMSASLKKDVCGLHAPGVLVTDVASTRVEQCLPLEVRYACLYWIQHLQEGNAQLYDNDQVHQFLQAHLLHWLEALSWIGKTSEGIRAILSLIAQIPVNTSPCLHAFIHDAKRFALYNRSVIEQAPLQLYCSALVFAPKNSIIRMQFKNWAPRWIETRPKVQANWSAVLQTLEGHLSYVTSVAFSPNGKLVVSGSGDMTVRLWDTVTGALQQILKGHSSSVSSVAFSPDGKLVVSGSGDMTVRLWDTTTGVLQQTFEGHSNSVSSVAFSPDGKLVVSGSRDMTVRFWDIATGLLQQTFEGYEGYVTSVAFSPNGKLVVFGSWDKTVRLWDMATGALQQTLKGHEGYVSSVAFSPDGKLVVSGSWDRTVRLWDTATGLLQQTFEGHSNSVSSVAFSPDGKLVVSGSRDMTVRFWNTATGTLQQILKGHSNSISSIAFSLNSILVVFGSADMTVRLWDTATGTLQQILKGHSNSVSSITFSPDGKLIASGSADMTVRLWDTTTGTLQQILKGHSSYINLIAFSPDGKLIISKSWDKTVQLWDIATGVLQQTLRGHSGYTSPEAFFPDSRVLRFNILNNWIVEGGTYILWLPLEYRATSVAIWNRSIVLGHSSGNISILKFRPGLKLI